MSTNILPFRRDLATVLESLVKLNADMSAAELFERHVQIIKLHDEGYDLFKLRLATITEVEQIMNAATSFDMLARRAGIPANVIIQFNSERLDRKAFEASRAALPKYRRL